MNDPRRYAVVAFAAALLACGDGHDTPEAPNTRDAVADAEPEAGARPMPRLRERAEAVVAELGPEAETLRATLTRPEGDYRRWHSESMAALSPRARASLRRHNVRIEQLARHLGITQP